MCSARIYCILRKKLTSRITWMNLSPRITHDIYDKFIIYFEEFVQNNIRILKLNLQDLQIRVIVVNVHFKFFLRPIVNDYFVSRQAFITSSVCLLKCLFALDNAKDVKIICQWQHSRFGMTPTSARLRDTPQFMEIAVQVVSLSLHAGCLGLFGYLKPPNLLPSKLQCHLKIYVNNSWNDRLVFMIF